MNKVLYESLMLKQIDLMKHKMIKLAKSTGINSPETLKCSQELDTLLNLHMKHFANINKLNNVS
jgi:hypothetical protein